MFESSEKPLNHDIVNTSTSTIHRYLNIMFFK